MALVRAARSGRESRLLSSKATASGRLSSSVQAWSSSRRSLQEAAARAAPPTPGHKRCGPACCCTSPPWWPWGSTLGNRRSRRSPASPVHRLHRHSPSAVSRARSSLGGSGEDVCICATSFHPRREGDAAGGRGVGPGEQGHCGGLQHAARLRQDRCRAGGWPDQGVVIGEVV
jgi:hypothetical protein